MDCQADGPLPSRPSSAELVQTLLPVRSVSGRRLQASMQKNGDAAITVVRRHKPRLFLFLRRDAKRREGKGARLRPIISCGYSKVPSPRPKRIDRSLDWRLTMATSMRWSPLKSRASPKFGPASAPESWPGWNVPFPLPRKVVKLSFSPLITSRSWIRSLLKSAKLTPSGRLSVR